MRDSAHHILAKWLAGFMEPVMQKKAGCSLKDIIELMASLKELNMKEWMMLSLDVATHFTNVPSKETIKYFYDHIENSGLGTGLLMVHLK